MSEELFQEMKRQTLAELAIHGVTGWRVAKMSGTSALGKCNYLKSTIYYNVNFLAHQDSEVIVGTMAHEIAHVLAPFDKHGPTWKAWVTRLGGQPKYGVDADDLVVEDSMYRYLGYCKAGHKFRYQRLPSRVGICTKCPKSLGHGNRFILLYQDGVPLDFGRFSAKYMSDVEYVRSREKLWFE